MLMGFKDSATRCSNAVPVVIDRLIDSFLGVILDIDARWLIPAPSRFRLAFCELAHRFSIHYISCLDLLFRLIESIHVGLIGADGLI